MTEDRPNDDGKPRSDPTEDDVLDELMAVIKRRQETLPDDSYTAELLEQETGPDAVLEKLGEEMTELLLATKNDDRDAVVHEAADIVYHLLVLLVIEELTMDDLRAELRDRRK